MSPASEKLHNKIFESALRKFQRGLTNTAGILNDTEHLVAVAEVMSHFPACLGDEVGSAGTARRRTGHAHRGPKHRSPSGEGLAPVTLC